MKNPEIVGTDLKHTEVSTDLEHTEVINNIREMVDEAEAGDYVLTIFQKSGATDFHCICTHREDVIVPQLTTVIKALKRL
jgi:hypothetical protein